ncbi:16S rRNA (guanine(527)-N(7))-methyltransferase RsmG [Phyllobacterium endophyticum]|uniref:Ribosomal RNA small subunit methyltransferase G n=1 Tax=Phyllobacterium endophyticum TaxID=1149773 RepID=A0A2P7AZ57_9HYPH|nr:16S rRNA (guanine(527)-N(7))-methyltransferase RsmG [Phyllobacterium endophyticum]MBB3235925.1 16S rRNA (guanine527-N7)-methyltransferase [Phyllobacterium endophyticum]PSH59491.1 16S rRNA (guanine(527)-N(7))-methyltransferase RsmG [Phyllobacterium endophyticum]TYR41629.1 16S rRNA (guanine(527)-N(7))-methyltransferase RsmG [Phyllobacterium endophyticum]
MTFDRNRRLREVAPDVSRETVDNLQAFEELFRKWSTAINLASPSSLEELWDRHILDSAQLFNMAPAAQTWLDLGSGGGFPGVVLAIMLKNRPGAHIDLVESNGKKAAFLRTALGRFTAPGLVHAARIDTMWKRIPTPEIITARALAPLGRLFELAEPWLTSGATALFQKGRDYQREIEESRDAWAFDLVERGSAVDKDSVVLQIENLRRTELNR